MLSREPVLFSRKKVVIFSQGIGSFFFSAYGFFFPNFLPREATPDDLPGKQSFLLFNSGSLLFNSNHLFLYSKQ